MADELQQKLQGVEEMARRQAGCAHGNFKWTYVANRVANGIVQVWRRCDGCGSNRLGAGKWIPHQYLRDKGIDIDAIPIVNDEATRRPPCRVCGARGTELHHWAPRAVFGEDAHLWPTDYLCRACHNQWHLAMARGPAQQQLDTVIPYPALRTAPRRVKRSTA